MSHFPIIELDTVDSTNNYAMKLIDADKAQHGLTVVTRSQSAGKGQRGKSWADTPDQSLLMSVITAPARPITDQFAFNASIAVAIANVLQKSCKITDIRIKWPNDIIINDKKAGGILIENILRGSKWTHSVIGLGLNVKQEHFPPELPFATSLKMAAGTDVEMEALTHWIIESIIETVDNHASAEMIMKSYNDFLYKRGSLQNFSDSNGQWDAEIVGANADGSLQLKVNNEKMISLHHGEAIWNWQ
jgi:BirA family transcriptional regulator, biotin operon repressor / biotin---[acetyl-CoA-carboxylase] ligase